MGRGNKDATVGYPKSTLKGDREPQPYHREPSMNFGKSSTHAKTPMKKDQSRLRGGSYAKQSYD